MARLARVVAAGLPHLVTQRGNRGQPTFFDELDYGFYKAMLAEEARRARVPVLAWCLMPNHLHLILVPSGPDGLAACLRETHRRYTTTVNRREGWHGYLWQGRFSSCVLDPTHLLAAAPYVEHNPVRAGLVERAEDWSWSSARAHLRNRGDGLVQVKPLLALVPDWRAFLAKKVPEPLLEALRQGERTGRPRGDEAFLAELEASLGRVLRRQKPGPKPRAVDR